MHKKDTLSIVVSLRLIQSVNKKIHFFLPPFRCEKVEWIKTTDDMKSKLEKKDDIKRTSGYVFNREFLRDLIELSNAVFLLVCEDITQKNCFNNKHQLGWLSLITSAHARMSTARLLYKRNEIFYPYLVLLWRQASRWFVFIDQHKHR